MKYKLKLEFFRCHEKKEIEFETGATLLLGDSGVGKTTIMQAIKFALYDNIKSPTTYGKKTCCVVLENDRIKITRKRPKKCIVEFEGNKYEDDAAQRIINSEFGERELFPYIEQFGFHKFIFCSAQERANMFKMLTMDTENVENIKNKIKNYLKKAEKSAEELEENYIKVKYHYDELKKDIPNLKEVKKEYSNTENLELQLKKQKEIKTELKDIINNMKKEEKELSEKKKEYNKYKNKLEELEKEDKTINYAEVDKLKKEKIEIDEQLANARIEEKYNQRKKEEIEDEFQKSELENSTVDIEEVKRRYTGLKELNKLKINNLKLETAKSDLEKFRTKIEIEKEYLRKLEEVNKQNEILEKEEKNIYSCPHCGEECRLNEDKLVKVEELKKKRISPPRKPRLVNVEIAKEKYPIYEKAINIFEEYGIFEFNEKSIELLKTQIDKYNTYQTLKKELDDFKEPVDGMKKQEYNMLLSKKESIQNKIKEIEEKNRQAQLTIDRIETITNQINTLDLSEIENKKEIENKIKEKVEKYGKLKDEICKLKNKIETTKKLERLRKVKDQVKEIKTIFEKQSKVLTNAKYIYEVTKKSEVECLESKIMLFNKELNDFLKRLFEEPILIEILTSKVNTTGTKKTEINIKTFYKGVDRDGINHLSGGELTRISIAFTLAFNSLLNNDLILLDESLNSVQSDLKDEIIDILSELNYTTLVVSHDVCEGKFNKIIQI